MQAKGTIRNTGSPSGDRFRNQLAPRERQAGPYGMAERLVVLTKPGNSGGGKGCVKKTRNRHAVRKMEVDPTLVPKRPQPFVPYIYSREELLRLLEATSLCEHPRSKVRAYTYRTLILLLYGAGLRISEALTLTLNDVSLAPGVIQIRESKFYKARLVPLGPDLVKALTSYANQRKKDHSAEPATPFFVTRTGSGLTRRAADAIFSRLRRHARVQRPDGGRFQPRLHDLRHSFAVHRLISWYRRGADVQRLLPQLATYLGHVHIAATQHYLTMTPELLREASQRFERHAWGGTA